MYEVIQLKQLFLDSHNYKLNVHVFEVDSPKAIVQVIHGMEEHQERYEPFVNFLNENGYTVVTSNMRGHGEDAPVLGYFAKKDGYKFLVDDQIVINNYIKDNYPNTDIYLFAHSMGTIIARNVLMTHSSSFAKVCLSGFPNPDFGAYAGIPIAKFISLFKGKKGHSKFVSNLSTGRFNKAIKNAKTDVDWVCANEETINAYIQDPYCGHGFTLGGFIDLYHLVIRMRHKSNYKNVNSMPILALRGANDPCTGYDKGSKKSLNILNHAGFKDIKEIKYENMRHEILNEKENKIVYNDILEFYSK